MSHRFTSRAARLLAFAITMALSITLGVPASPASAEPIYLPDGSQQNVDVGFLWDARTDQLTVYNLEPFPVTFSHTDSTYGAQSVVVQPRSDAMMCMDVMVAPERTVNVTYSGVSGFGYIKSRSATTDLETVQAKVAEVKVLLSEAKAKFRKARAKFKQAERRLKFAKVHHLNRSVIQRATVAKVKAQKAMNAARRARDAKARRLEYEQGLLKTMQEQYAYCSERRIN